MLEMLYRPFDNLMGLMAIINDFVEKYTLKPVYNALVTYTAFDQRILVKFMVCVAFITRWIYVAIDSTIVESWGMIVCFVLLAICFTLFWYLPVFLAYFILDPLERKNDETMDSRYILLPLSNQSVEICWFLLIFNVLIGQPEITPIYDIILFNLTRWLEKPPKKKSLMDTILSHLPQRKLATYAIAIRPNTRTN